jgi:TRAP-type mannitol/chloroaromatic compound transport system permease small subunit
MRFLLQVLLTLIFLIPFLMCLVYLFAGFCMLNAGIKENSWVKKKSGYYTLGLTIAALLITMFLWCFIIMKF